MSVRVVVQYFDGCPSWRVAVAHLTAAAEQAGVAVEIDLQRIETDADARRLGFAGSPTMLVGGVDLFAGAQEPAGLTCRMYATPGGLAGAPTVEQLVACLGEHAGNSG